MTRSDSYFFDGFCVSLRRAALLLAAVFVSAMAWVPSASGGTFYIDAASSSVGVTNIYGTTWSGTTVTNWGTHYTDYQFQLSASPDAVIDTYAMQVLANKGNNVAFGNSLRATWFNGPAVANPNFADALGSIDINSSAVSSSFTTLLIGPDAFKAPLTLTSTPTTYFIRLWSEGNTANTGFGAKMTSNATITYSSGQSITMQNYNGSSYVTAVPSTTLIPEPSTYLLLLIAGGALIGLRRFSKSRI